MQVTQQRYYTPEEYLELEEAADYKSEYIDGQIIPVAGGRETKIFMLSGYAKIFIHFMKKYY